MTYNIVGTSMLPCLSSDMKVQVTPKPYQKVRLGDIILAWNHISRKMYIHRVISKRKGSIITKGDNNWRRDVDIVCNQNIFVVSQIIKNHKVVDCNKWKYRSKLPLYVFLSVIRFFPMIHRVPIKMNVVSNK